MKVSCLFLVLNCDTEEPELEKDFEATVQYLGCSAAIIRFDDNQPEDKGVLLTNGHCVEFLSPNTAIGDIDEERVVSVLNSNGNETGTLFLTKLLYATMTNTDLALFELEDSYQEIQNRFGIEALILSRTPATGGTAIRIPSALHLEEYRCDIDGIVPTLRESVWEWTNSLRYFCDTIKGTSGAPIIALESGLVIGVNNTVSSAGVACEIDSPCEVNDDGSIIFMENLAYGQQTSDLYLCRDEVGELDFGKTECPLLPISEN